MPNQSMPMGLSNEPRLRQRQVKSALWHRGMDDLHVLLDRRHHFRPAAGVDQAEDRNQQRAQPDQEELQHLVEDGRDQAAQGDVDGHRQRGDPDADVHVPAQQQVQDLRHGEHAGPADQDGHEGERDARHGCRCGRRNGVSDSRARSASCRCSRTASSRWPGRGWREWRRSDRRGAANMPYW